MWQVEIEWAGQWYPIGQRYRRRDDAEWAIATWRQRNGSNGKDTGFRTSDLSDEYVTLDSALSHGRHEQDSGCDLGAPTRDVPKYTGPNLA